ncbi:MAG: hypothetical protein AB7F23_03055 [Phycisphaerae bacterium]
MPYRSGYDLELVKKHFAEHGFETVLVSFADILPQHLSEWSGRIVVYTSSEEIDYNYKDFIEDVVYSLELSGAWVIPSFKFLRANNNKVFMELLRHTLYGNDSNISSRVFGTYEELGKKVNAGEISFPCVIKRAKGAQSKGVSCARYEAELTKVAKSFSRTPHMRREIKDWLRQFKLKGYQKESRFQNKYIVQPMINGLTNDWKILIYSNRYYILRRNNRPNDFRASGSGLFSPDKQADFPMKMLDYVEGIFEKTDVPNLSVDFAYDGNKGYIIEIQAMHFGKSTIYYCNNYCTRVDGKWTWVDKDECTQEELYVKSIVDYLKKHSTVCTN